MYSYAIIGFGGLGKTHAANLDKIAKKRGDMYLKGIYGTSAEEFSKSVDMNIGSTDISGIDISECTFYDDYRELILKEKPDIVISALPTFLHEEVAVFALENGCHVFSEKPMALTLDGCENMINTARKNGRKLMIGHCLRFSPAYALLKEYISTERWGRPVRAEFSRYSKTPLWTVNNWILNPERSGGCVLDMHVHDVDLINWYFGMPSSVDSLITNNKVEAEAVFSRYYYDSGLLVTANADWSFAQKYPFENRCIVNFENAVVQIVGDKLTVYAEDEVIAPWLPSTSYFETEMNSFIEFVIDGTECESISAESVLDSMKIAFKELEEAKLI